MLSILLSGCQTLAKIHAKREEEKRQHNEMLQEKLYGKNAPQHNTLNKNNDSYSGRWATLFKRGKENRASLYTLQNKRGSFNASMIAFTMTRGSYKKTAVQPVGWRASPDKKKIHTRLWDKKKTAYWDVTWVVNKMDSRSGEMIVTQTIDGLKGNGSKLTLKKCGSPSTQSNPYRSLCR